MVDVAPIDLEVPPRRELAGDDIIGAGARRIRYASGVFVNYAGLALKAIITIFIACFYFLVSMFI